MRANRIAGVCGGLLLLAGAAEAGRDGRQESRSPQHQTRGMIERMHNRSEHRGDRRHEGAADHRRGRHERQDRQHDRDRDRHHHDARTQRDRDRHLHWGHERWRESTHRHRHSPNGRGYWHDYHHGRRHHHHGYRHRFYGNYHYYYNSVGFYFPGYGFIAHGHAHGLHCPHWHLDDFAAGFVLGAIIYD